VIKIELRPVNMIRESGYVAVLFRTINEKRRICGESLWLIFPLLIVLVRALLKFPVLKHIHSSLLPFHDQCFHWLTCAQDFFTPFVTDWLILLSLFHVWPLTSSLKPTSFQTLFTSSLKMEAAALFVNFF